VDEVQDKAARSEAEGAKYDDGLVAAQAIKE
jgi:hypothetical protein